MCPSEAPSHYQYKNDKYYFVDGVNRKSYLEAVNICGEDGARVAMMKTQEEYVNVWQDLMTCEFNFKWCESQVCLPYAYSIISVCNCEHFAPEKFDLFIYNLVRPGRL